MIYKQHSSPRQKKAVSKFKLVVHIKKHFTCLLSVMLMTMFLFVSGCAGDNKKLSAPETEGNQVLADAIATRLLSHFESDALANTEYLKAEVIADGVVNAIVSGQYRSGISKEYNLYPDTIDPIEVDPYIENIIGLLYDADWHGYPLESMKTAELMFQALGEDETNPFVMTIETDGDNQVFKFKTYASGNDETFYRMNYSVDCGNGDELEEVIISTKPAQDKEHTCTFASAGRYTISVTQQLTTLALGLPQLRITAGHDYLLAIDQWGSGYWLSMRAMFKSVPVNFIFPHHKPKTRQLQSMQEMFNKASQFNQPIGAWDVGQVSNMASTFAETSVFNTDIGGWDVSSVTDMSLMFYRTGSFDQPLSNWNVSNVTDMSYMFHDATGFNQDINKWFSLLPNDGTNVTINIHSISGGNDALSSSNCTWCKL